MTTPPTGGSGPGWSVPERGPSGWGPAPGTQASAGTPGAPGGSWPPPGAGARPGGWGQLTGPGPQPYGSIITRRGIIALKPLGISDFFDGGFRAIRHNPRVMIGLSALVLALSNIVVALPIAGIAAAGDLFDPTASQEPSEDQLVAMGGSALALIPAGLVSSVATIALTGILILSVTQSVVDRRLSAGELWRRSRGRLLPLVGWSLLQSVGTSLLFVLAAAPGLVLLALEELAGGLTALVVLPLACLVLLVWLYVMLVFVPVLIVVERLGIVASARRSFALVRGAFWRTVLVLFLASIVYGVVSQVLGVPFSLLGGLGLVLAENSPALGVTIYAGSIALASTVGLVLAVPFLAAVVALLYVDRRIRLEGLDVALARSLEDGQA